MYLGAQEYELLAYDEHTVRLYDPTFPIFNKELPREEFDRLLAENPLNDKLLQVAEDAAPVADAEEPDTGEPLAASLPVGRIDFLGTSGSVGDSVEYCIQTGRLYESLPYHNVVFVGQDQTGQPRYAALRGIVGDFKGEAPGSDKRYSFAIAENPDAPSVHLFESAIDLLSYATLLKMKGRDWRQDTMLSLAGVFKQNQEFVIPLALSQYLQDHSRVQTIHLHLDNDAVGRDAAEGIRNGMQGQYEVLDQPPPRGKDVNEFLMRRLGLHRAKEEYVR